MRTQLNRAIRNEKFCVMLEELADCYDAHHEVEITVNLKQYQYD